MDTKPLQDQIIKLGEHIDKMHARRDSLPTRKAEAMAKIEEEFKSEENQIEAELIRAVERIANYSDLIEKIETAEANKEHIDSE